MRIILVCSVVILAVTGCSCPHGKQESSSSKATQFVDDIALELSLLKQSLSASSEATQFVDDPVVLGDWQSVDFVRNITDFRPGAKRFKGDLYLKDFSFAPNGKTHKSFWTWSKGGVYNSSDKSTAHYTIKTIEGETYLFLEWMSGDVLIRDMKPQYYVLRKTQ